MELYQIWKKGKKCKGAGHRVNLNKTRQRRNLKKSKVANFHVNIIMSESENRVLFDFLVPKSFLVSFDARKVITRNINLTSNYPLVITCFIQKVPKGRAQ
jgi:hypothetical protein